MVVGYGKRIYRNTESDSKGRIYLSSRLKNKTVYIFRRNDILIVATSRSILNETLKKFQGKSTIEEYMNLLSKLGEPTPKEIEKFARKRTWKKLEEYS